MENHPHERNAAFTLIELMIVVAILAIIMAIAIPAMQAAKKSGNEAAAISRLKITSTVSEQYFIRFGEYASSLADMVNAGMMPDYSATSPAYTYAYSPSTWTWRMNADPTTPGVTGDRYFYVDHTGVIRFSSTGSADSTSTPVD